MSKGTYLRQKGTGRVYAWSSQLAKRKDMRPFDPSAKEAAGNQEAAKVAKPEKPPPGGNDPSGDEAKQSTGTGAENDGQTEESSVDLSDAIIVNDERVRLSEASRDVLADYAERHFGVNMDRRKKSETLAQELRDLIAEHGHPDADD